MEKTFGSTGHFPLGKLSPDDEGELRMGIAADHIRKVVLVNFGKPIVWLGLPKAEALALAKGLTEAAEQLG